MPAKAAVAELRIGIGSGEEWVRDARAVSGGAAKDGVMRYEIPSADWTGRNVTIGARTSIRPGKPSNWSNFVTLQVVAPPPTPALAEPQATAKGIRLSWDGAAGNFRVFRRTGDEKTFATAANVSENNWVDTGAEYQKAYTYMVQRVVKLEGGREAVSEPSQERSITAKDTFPPEAPAGLSASAAPNSIELTWEGNSEADLAGYRVYRAPPGGNFERITETPAIPHYSDASAERGKMYRYAVSAFDRAGNESAQSAPSEAVLP
jgi:fibronectin type 3 domain-containing protein